MRDHLCMGCGAQFDHICPGCGIYWTIADLCDDILDEPTIGEHEPALHVPCTRCAFRIDARAERHSIRISAAWSSNSGWWYSITSDAPGRIHVCGIRSAVASDIIGMHSAAAWELAGANADAVLMHARMLTPHNAVVIVEPAMVPA